MFQEEIMQHGGEMLGDAVVRLQHVRWISGPVYRWLVSLPRSGSSLVHLRLALAMCPVCRTIAGVSSVSLLRCHPVQIFAQSQRSGDPLSDSSRRCSWHHLVRSQLHIQRSRRGCCTQNLIDQLEELLHDGILAEVILAFHHLLVCHPSSVVAHHNLWPGQSALSDVNVVLKSLHKPHWLIFLESTGQHWHMACPYGSFTSCPRLAQVCYNNLAIDRVPRHAHVQVN
mmetsp:Transcript_30916/g.80174  ORF Transcript_30916/g.80174 Transcript_30916/m.80174 type:complete len:227 (+) Transcript_30916:833-1513(+)